MLFATLDHLKALWLVIVLEAGVVLDSNFLGNPLHILDLFEAELSVVGPSPAVELVLDVDSNDFIIPLKLLIILFLWCHILLSFFLILFLLVSTNASFDSDCVISPSCNE